jgi:hypothetical protein
VDGYNVANINKKFLGFAGFLAAFIALIMIGGIWFGNSWILSPWFWLIVFSCLVVSALSFITWRIDFAYEGVELEAGDLADEDESELVKGAPKPADRPVAAAISKSKQPMKIDGIVQRPAPKQAPKQTAQAGTAMPAKPTVAASLAASLTKPQPITTQRVDDTSMVTEQKPGSKAVPFAASAPAGKTVESKANLVTQLGSAHAKDAKVEEGDGNAANALPAVKIKLNRKNVHALIDVYREEGYNVVSFSKFRNEMGVGKDKKVLKLKKLLLESVAMGLLAKKGSKYIIQREGQEPLD